MARYLFQHRTTAIALLIVALTTCGLTACGSSSDPTTTPQASSITPQEAARRHKAVLEIFNCARRHGIHLPPPTETGINVSAVKGRHNEDTVSACYQKALKKGAREARAQQAEAAEQASNPPTLGGESSG